MAAHLLQLLLALLLIVLAAELFTNALESLGERLGISEGVTGSIFAAVGTALPETVIPLLALASGGGADARLQVATGAILGAPLMLSTLTMFLMAASTLPGRGAGGRLRPEPSGIRRDLNCFLLAFVLAGAGMFLPAQANSLRVLLAVLLAGLYGAYLVATVRASRGLVAEGHATRADLALWLTRVGLPSNAGTQAGQLAGASALLLAGASAFIDSVEALSNAAGISALTLALVVIPIATELPEKINSILWVRRGKDTLALSNITGAMVFQGTLLPAIGLAFTPWQDRGNGLASVVVTLCAAAWLRACCRPTGLPVLQAMAGVLLYAGYLAYALRG